MLGDSEYVIFLLLKLTFENNFGVLLWDSRDKFGVLSINFFTKPFPNPEDTITNLMNEMNE